MKDDSLRAEVSFPDQVGPGSPLSVDEWKRKYRSLKYHADMMSSIMNDVARKISGDAGLDPLLLGIHPNNAMVSFEAGQPWENIDYNRVMAVQELLQHEFDANSMVDAFDKAVRGHPHERWLAKNSESVIPEPTKAV